MNKVERFIVIWVYNSLLPTVIVYASVGLTVAAVVGAVTTWTSYKLYSWLTRLEKKLKENIFTKSLFD